MNLLVKVCGMTDGENIRRVEELGVDFIGFVFYPRSPRFVYQMPDYLPRRARRIGVFVNETKETVLTYADRFELDYVQLHGKESPLYCQSLRESHGLKVIKAFHLATPRDVAATETYHSTCDYFLFESKTPPAGRHGTAVRLEPAPPLRRPHTVLPERRPQRRQRKCHPSVPSSAAGRHRPQQPLRDDSRPERRGTAARLPARVNPITE